MVAGRKNGRVRADNQYKCGQSQQLCKLRGSFVDLIKETSFNEAAVKSLKYKSRPRKARKKYVLGS